MDELKEPYEIRDKIVLVSDALLIANEKLKKLQSTEDVEEKK
jgi:hypothetical protein